jgi:hypothetical protein
MIRMLVLAPLLILLICGSACNTTETPTPQTSEQQMQPATSVQPVAAPTISPSEVEVFAASMRLDDRVIMKGNDRRPVYRVVGRIRNNSAVEIGEVQIRISIFDKSKAEVDGADISISSSIPPGAARAFDRWIQLLPPPNWTWTCDVISATPKQ